VCFVAFGRLSVSPVCFVTFGRLIVSPISFTLSFFAFCFGHNHLPLTPEVLEGLCAQLGILRCVLDIRVAKPALQAPRIMARIS